MVAPNSIKLRILSQMQQYLLAQMVLCFLFWGQHFDTETQDLFGIEWAPNGCVLAVWDTCLEVWKKNLVIFLEGAS